MQPEQPGTLENALSHLQCVLVARRARINPEQLTYKFCVIEKDKKGE
ncbi:hypothetical protein N2384_05925 [Bacillus paralicheniformis]|nr:hypothetical protein [Bacillus paralicheniformis]UWS62576.1 hypothetical protein N2384_05925 [Bacillus paralicheniformis]